jgi:hypothetical protein
MRVYVVVDLDPCEHYPVKYAGPSFDAAVNTANVYNLEYIFVWSNGVQMSILKYNRLSDIFEEQ